MNIDYLIAYPKGNRLVFNRELASLWPMLRLLVKYCQYSGEALIVATADNGNFLEARTCL